MDLLLLPAFGLVYRHGERADRLAFAHDAYDFLLDDTFVWLHAPGLHERNQAVIYFSLYGIAAVFLVLAEYTPAIFEHEPSDTGPSLSTWLAGTAFCPGAIQFISPIWFDSGLFYRDDFR